jgi:hypothetical protein
MKTKFLILYVICLLAQCKTYAQDTTITELTSVFGVQAGLSGINIHKEIPISESIVLRPEVGFGFEFYYSYGFDLTLFSLIPKAGMDTKWYYNLKNRNKKGRNTEDNAANFFAFNIVHYSNLFDISNYSPKRDNLINFVPNWGIRRNLGKHFNYEFALGYGVSYAIESESTGKGLFLDFKIGYKFH